jgi:hypothetical protein
MWALSITGVALVLIGWFWPGAIALTAAAVVRIGWDAWARREQARFDVIANHPE